MRLNCVGEPATAFGLTVSDTAAGATTTTVVFAVAVAPPVALATAARAPRPPAPQDGTWAVVLGVNDYPGDDSDLSYSVNDAQDVVAALAALGVPAENMLLAVDGQATADVIRASIDWRRRSPSFPPALWVSSC